MVEIGNDDLLSLFSNSGRYYQVLNCENEYFLVLIKEQWKTFNVVMVSSEDLKQLLKSVENFPCDTSLLITKHQYDMLCANTFSLLYYRT